MITLVMLTHHMRFNKHLTAKLTFFIVGVYIHDVVECVLDELKVHAHHVPRATLRVGDICRGAGRRANHLSDTLVEHLGMCEEAMNR